MIKYIFLILVLFTVTGCVITVPPKTVQVEIIKFKFVPADIIINKGDSVIWTNKEKRQYHSVRFEQMGAPEPDYMFPGDIFTQTFDEAGKFPYRCGPHPKMLGSVTVK
ncbi:MAG TPA: plastocyanin [Sphingomonadales bacterium]|nr:plastocyanin [Sphingomonadales bacterium]